MKKHPILSSCLIVALILVFFMGLAALTLGWWRKDVVWSKKEKVGVVEVTGLVTKSQPTLKNLRKFSEDKRVKAILLRVDSPGGAVAPSQEILREIEKTKKIKKVVASLGSLAGSGGYYVAWSAAASRPKAARAPGQTSWRACPSRR